MKFYLPIIVLVTFGEIISGFPQSDAVNFNLRRVKSRRPLISFNSTEAKVINVSGFRNSEGKLTKVDRINTVGTLKPTSELPSKINVLFHDNVKHRAESFPNSVHSSSRKENCGKTYCEETNDYPYEEIAGLDLSSFDLFFDGNKHLGSVELRKMPEDEFEDLPDERMCMSYKRTLAPRNGINLNGVWRTIINQDSKRQTANVEFCGDTSQLSSNNYKQLETKSSCNEQIKFPNTINRTECRQSYAVRKLVALDSDGRSIIDDFMLPTYCKCVLIKNNPETFFGVLE